MKTRTIRSPGIPTKAKLTIDAFELIGAPLRENWNVGPETHKRGRDWLDTIYKENQASTDAAFAAHRDIDFINYNITYGFYLSDMTILGPVETELVVLSGIMIQNLGRLTGWHLRGIRRVGVSKEDVELVQQCVSVTNRNLTRKSNLTKSVD